MTEEMRAIITYKQSLTGTRYKNENAILSGPVSRLPSGWCARFRRQEEPGNISDISQSFPDGAASHSHTHQQREGRKGLFSPVFTQLHWDFFHCIDEKSLRVLLS